ncbi:MAG: hypothetical protein JSS00_13325, partial [Proteobacteria bacterium]|nr:hypothetical protein [Pseudomonadota bacterium]
MNLRLALIAALMAASAGMAPLAPAAATPSSPHDDCFPTRAITGYGLVDPHTAYLTVGTRHYLVRITGDSRDLDYNYAISVRSLSTFICTGNGLGVQLMGGYPPIPHQVLSIERAPPGNPPLWSGYG